MQRPTPSSLACTASPDARRLLLWAFLVVTVSLSIISMLRPSASAAVRGNTEVRRPSALYRSYTAEETLAALLGNATELAAQGGVYIFSPQEMLPPGVSMYPLSGGKHIDWLNQYGLEQTLIRVLRESPYVTTDPSQARVFVVPQQGTAEVHSCLYAISPIPPNRIQDCGANISRDYLLPIINKLKATPWYKRNDGRDFVWVFPWDASWTMFPGVPEALATNKFWGYTGPAENLITVPVTARVTAAPEDVERNFYRAGGRAGPPGGILFDHDGHKCTSYPEHKYLASFAGTVWQFREYSKGIRQDLLAAYPESKAAETRMIVLDRHVGADEYKSLLRDSLFCLSPPGWTAWSQRLYFAIAAGCIPVFFEAPGMVIQLPYDGLIDWSSVSLIVPEGRHMDVKDMLLRVTPEQVCQMRHTLTKLAPYLLWGHSPQLTLLGALHGAWQAVRNLPRE